jgi:hypothetical protein
MLDEGAIPAHDGGDIGPGMTFSAEDLPSEGKIAGVPVRCLSVEMHRGHTGYELPERQIGDLELLQERLTTSRRGRLCV